MTDFPHIDENVRIALVGCGKMGEAILAGWLASDAEPANVLGPGNFTIVDPNDDNRARVESAYGVSTIADVAELDEFNIAVLAVKPQVMSSVLPLINADGKLLVTIAAGLPTTVFEEAHPHSRVVRVMPNMPLQVGMGASVVAKGASAFDADAQLVNALFEALGTSTIVPESQIDAVCAISGGGPAYVAYMIEALRDAGVELGLEPQLAEQLALQTVGGTFAAMDQQGTSPEDMRISVCSPGGTTLAALAKMDEYGFKRMYADAMRSAVDRAEELRSGKAN